MSTLIWLRNDLRLFDNSLFECEGPVQLLYLLDDTDPWAPGRASRSWLHHSLKAFSEEIEKLGGSLVLRRGDPLEEIPKAMEESGATCLRMAARYEPHGRAVDEKLISSLRVEIVPGNLLLQPGSIPMKQVYTPFSKSYSGLNVEAPRPIPQKISFAKKIASLSLNDLNLLPTIPWDRGFYSIWTPGERGAHRFAKQFLEQPILSYKEERDFPSHKGVSRLSPHLHFGEISVKALYYAIKKRYPKEERGVHCYISELIWREFAHHLLYHFPETVDKPLHKKYAAFPWLYDEKNLKRWQEGKTGYPIVDAGMRELWQTGWMHNRVRMVVGSFLTKDLLLPWQEGALWFWDTLVDADLASNTLGWQWVAGCGADAQPFFRIFNPILQGEKFDPEGEYVRTYLPELKDVPTKWIHKPWEAPFPYTQPKPIIDHAFARERALNALEKIK